MASASLSKRVTVEAREKESPSPLSGAEIPCRGNGLFKGPELKAWQQHHCGWDGMNRRTK